jgi:hypothetical protein
MGMKKLKIVFFVGVLLSCGVLLPKSLSSETLHSEQYQKQLIQKRWQHGAILARGGSRAYGDFYRCNVIKKHSDYLGTQSGNHCKKNSIQLKVPRSEFFMTQDFIRKCLRKERVLQAADYVTFYHGQASEKYMPIKLDTLLYGIRTGRNTDNFLLLHTKPDPVLEGLSKAKPGSSEQLVRRAVLKEESNRRERLLSGPAMGEAHTQYRPFYLFLNDSLAGNCTEDAGPGCSSWIYFRSNSNCGNSGCKIENDGQTIFNNHGYGAVAAEFLAEFAQLQQEYLALSKFGTLYLIGIPKERVHLSVAPARAFGYIRPLKVDGQ